MNGSSWQLEYQCPQCGAPLLLEETDRVLQCGYCKVTLVYGSGSFFKTYLHADPAPGPDTVFIPYWRFKGLRFTCGPDRIAHRLVDTTFRAVGLPALPPSLGLKPQAVKRRFLTPEVPGRFLAPEISLEEGISHIQHRTAGGAAAPVPHEAYVGEAMSLIHVPVAVQGNTVYDAISRRVLCPLTREIEERIRHAETEPRWPVSFLPALCPHCGWDLESSPDSHVFLCRHCNSAWSAEEGRLVRYPFGVVSPSFSPEIHLPFWRIRAEVTGTPFRCYADLVRHANLPRAVQPAWEEQPVYFWSPAFKLHPALFLRLCRLITVAQLPVSTGVELPATALGSANLPSSESRDALKTTLAALSVKKRKFFPTLPRIRIVPRETLLVFLPFVQSGQEWVHPRLRIGVNRNAIHWGKRL